MRAPVVVPVRDEQRTRTHKCTSMYAATAGTPEELKTKSNACTLAFAVTDYKLQGMTLPHLVLSVVRHAMPTAICAAR